MAKRPNPLLSTSFDDLSVEQKAILAPGRAGPGKLLIGFSTVELPNGQKRIWEYYSDGTSAVFDENDNPAQWGL